MKEHKTGVKNTLDIQHDEETTSVQYVEAKSDGESDIASSSGEHLILLEEAGKDAHENDFLQDIPYVGDALHKILFPWDRRKTEKDEAERLALLSDAIASIIATFMILPLMEGVEELKEDPKEYPLLKLFTNFLVSYSVIGVLVYANIRAFENIAMHPVQITFNLLYLLTLCFVPITQQAMRNLESVDSGLNPSQTSDAFIVQGLVFGFLMLFQGCFSISCLGVKKVWETQFLEVGMVLAGSALFFALAIVAGALKGVHSKFLYNYGVFIELGLLVLFAVVWAVFKNNCLGWRSPKSKSCGCKNFRRLKKKAPVDRVKGFTDGIYAIAATLAGIELRDKAYEDWKIVCTLVVTFIGLLAQWYLHYLIFRSVEGKVDDVTYELNLYQLCLVVVISWGVKVAFELGHWWTLLPLVPFVVNLIGFGLMYLKMKEKIPPIWVGNLVYISALVLYGAFAISIVAIYPNESNASTPVIV